MSDISEFKKKIMAETKVDKFSDESAEFASHQIQKNAGAKISMTELDIHLALCRYIKIKDGKALFSTNYAAGLKLTPRQASIQSKLQSHRGAPDLMIYEPRNGHVGLAIEIKRENTRLTKKDGSPASEHIKEQNEYLEALRKRGWKCFFCVGYDDSIKTIDEYLGIDTLKVEF